MDTDPTNARHRDFDIPVIMPRIDFIDLPESDDCVLTGDWDHPGQRFGSPWGWSGHGRPGRGNGKHR